MHVDRIRAGVKSLREQADEAGRDWKTIEVCPQFVVHVGKTREKALESFRKSQMNKHLVSLQKSTLKGQGAATHEEINLIGTPAEVIEKALAFKEAGLATVEEQDIQLAVVMETLDDAWRVFSRTYIAQVLDDEGREDLQRVLKRRMPHTLYLPLRFLRTRRPG